MPTHLHPRRLPRMCPYTHRMYPCFRSWWVSMNCRPPYSDIDAFHTVSHPLLAVSPPPPSSTLTPSPSSPPPPSKQVSEMQVELGVFHSELSRSAEIQAALMDRVRQADARAMEAEERAREMQAALQVRPSPAPRTLPDGWPAAAALPAEARNCLGGSFGLWREGKGGRGR